jgi:hypothetical protein
MTKEMDLNLVTPQFETSPVKGISTVSSSCSFGRKTLQDYHDGIKDPWMHDL